MPSASCRSSDETGADPLVQTPFTLAVIKSGQLVVVRQAISACIDHGGIHQPPPPLSSCANQIKQCGQQCLHLEVVHLKAVQPGEAEAFYCLGQFDLHRSSLLAVTASLISRPSCWYTRCSTRPLSIRMTSSDCRRWRRVLNCSRSTRYGSHSNTSGT